MNTKQKNLIEKIIAILIILILNLVQYLFVGIGIVSYAQELKNINNENIEFSAYFLDDNGEKQERIEENIDAENVKMMIDISVKNEGYFNGKITVTDNNFTFKKEIENEYIKEISDNEIILNQIDAGNKVTLELGIISKKEDVINLSNLDTKVEIKLEGEYINSKNIEKNKADKIEGVTKLEIKWKSNDETKVELDTSILTNFIYEINGEQKRVLQVALDSKISNNSYPVRNTQINLSIPDNTEKIDVHARSTKATNDSIEFDENNYMYDNENQILTINILNDDENNISWNKDAYDTFVVTYVFDEKEDIMNKKITVDSLIKTYDNKEVKDTQEVVVEKQIDGIVSYSQNSIEDSIYKGKIYTGEQRDYIIQDTININYTNIVNSIEIKENETKYLVEEEERESKILYKETKINKQQFLNIFGENGYITIENQDGVVISNINKDTEENEDGNIIVKYVDETKSINILTSNPVSIGVMNIENTKTILDAGYTREEIKEITNIEDTSQLTYTKNDNTINKIENSSKIDLKETHSNATLNLSRTHFTTESINENIEITAILQTNGEDLNLYKNPEIEIILPKEISNIIVKQAKALYKNGLKLETSNLYHKEDGRIAIYVKFKGQQEKYDTNEGLELHLYLDIDVDKAIKESTSTEVEMNYTNVNDGTSSNIKEKIEIEVIESDKVSTEKLENTVQLTENREELKLDVTAKVGGEELQDGDEVKAGEIIEYEVTIVNNVEEKIEDATIIASIPENTKIIEINPNYLNSSGMGIEIQDPSAIEPYFIEKSDRQRQETGITIAAGEKFIYTYMVRVDEDLSEDKNIESSVSIQYHEKLQNIVRTNKATKSLLVSTLAPVQRTGKEILKPGKEYTYEVKIYNPTNEEQRDVQVTINKNNLINIDQIILYAEDDSRIIEPETLVFSINSIPAKGSVSIGIDAIIEASKQDITMAEISASIKDSEENIYRTNKLSEKVSGVKIDAELSTDIESETEYLYSNDNINYIIKIKNIGDIKAESLKIEDRFSDYLELKSVKVNGNEYNYTQDSDFTEGSTYSLITIENLKLDVEEEMTIIIEASVSEVFNTLETLKAINQVFVYNDKILLATTEEDVRYIDSDYLDLEEDDDNEDENNNNNNKDDNNDNQSNYIISGTVWVDSNKNGKRDEKEQLKSDIEVRAIDIQTRTVLNKTSKTEQNGKYNIELPEGKYILVFTYDTSRYYTTIYQAKGVESSLNSDAVTKEVTIDGKKNTYGVTDEIEVKSNKIDINMGLIEKEKFDLKLDKFVSKVVITNDGGTKEKIYNNNTTLAKAEIKAKYLNSSVVRVEYTLRITNEGELAGYASSIVDKIPSGLEYVSTLNSGWYIKDNKLYNDTLANKKIEPGKSEEVKLILTKNMMNSNTGLFKNDAEIAKIQNERGYNDETLENNNSSAELIISVSTGKTITYIAIVLTTLITISIGIYVIIRRKSIKI